MASFIRHLASSVTRGSLPLRQTKKITSLCQEMPLVQQTQAFSCLSATQKDTRNNITFDIRNNKSFLNITQSGFASLHTEGDRRFVELLQQEIEEEKGKSAAMPGLSDGWKVKFLGAEGVLSRSQDGDKIDVSFSLNGSVPPMHLEDEEVEPDITSYPDFTVKVTKAGNSKTVEFECYFPEDVQEGIADESMSLFSVRSILVYEGEVEDETYMIDTEHLDPSVYSYFLSYLADRGVDSQFAQEFIQLCTVAEHDEYVRSLEKLKSFISSK